MNYYIRRGSEEFGPYTVGDLHRYLGTGHVSPQDMVRAEDGSPGPQSVAELLGIQPSPPAFPQPLSPATGFAPSTVPGAYGTGLQKPIMANGAQLPPDLHWGLVLLLHFLTCGLFAMIWLLVQAWWVRQIKPGNKGIWYLAAYIGVGYSAMVPYMGLAAIDESSIDGADPIAMGLLLFIVLISLGSTVLYIVGVFSMRGAMLDYFNHTENIGLRLNGILTFFFALFYFQYHLSRIARWKKTGILA